MKNIRVFLSENFQFLEVKLSVYLNRHVFVMENISFIRTLNNCICIRAKHVADDILLFCNYYFSDDLHEI